MYALRFQPREPRSEKKQSSTSSAADGSKVKAPPQAQALKASGRMIEIQCNDRLGKKIRVKARYSYIRSSQPDHFYNLDSNSYSPSVQEILLEILRNW